MKTIISLIAAVIAAMVVLPHLSVGSDSFIVDPAYAVEVVEWPDSDGDGCLDGEELGSDWYKGGNRDPFTWDFADLTGRGPDRLPDGVVDTLDTHAIAFRYGAVKGTLLYDEHYDVPTRDGDIDINDLQYVYGQFGASCLAPETTPVSEIAPLCDGNFKEEGEAAGVAIAAGVEMVPGETYKECRMIRDDAGVLVDVAILDETVQLTDIAFSDDPVDPVMVEAGIAPPVPPEGEHAGSSAESRVWSFGCFTGHNRAYSFWGYTLYDLALKECFASVIQESNPYYGITLETSMNYWNTANYPYTIESGEFSPAVGEPPRWNTFGFDFERERWGVVYYRPCCQNWTTRTVHTGVRVFWAHNRSVYGDFPDSPGVLGYIWY